MPHFLHNFWRKIFLLLSSITWSKFINSVQLLSCSFQYTFFLSPNTCFTSASSYLWSHEFPVWKLSSSCLLNPVSASGCLITSTDWSINFLMIFLFYMSLSSVCPFSICQLRKCLHEFQLHLFKPEQYMQYQLLSFWPFLCLNPEQLQLLVKETVYRQLPRKYTLFYKQELCKNKEAEIGKK